MADSGRRFARVSNTQLIAVPRFKLKRDWRCEIRLGSILAVLSCAFSQPAHSGSTCANSLCCTEWKVQQYRSGKYWADIKKPTYDSLSNSVESSKAMDRRLCNYFHGDDCSVTYSTPMCATATPREARPTCPGYRGVIPSGARTCRGGEAPAVVDFYGKNLSCSWCY